MRTSDIVCRDMIRSLHIQIYDLPANIRQTSCQRAICFQPQHVQPLSSSSIRWLGPSLQPPLRNVSTRCLTIPIGSNQHWDPIIILSEANLRI